MDALNIVSPHHAGSGVDDGAARAATAAKITRRLIPVLILLYMTAFLDRSNVGMAKAALGTDLGIGNTTYAFGSGIFFLGYALFEMPSNLMLLRAGPRRWIGRIMISWGLISAAMMFVGGPVSFSVMRLLLGIAEAGFFPGIMLYLTFWFPQRERTRALGLYFLGYPLAMVVGNPLSGLLFKLDGLLGLHGWQWMFLVEGLLAVVVGMGVSRLLPNGPREVSWLSGAESDALQAVLTQEAAESGSGHGSLWQAIRSMTTVKLVALYALLQVASYGVVFYLPEQVSVILSMKTGPMVGLVSGLPWACALLATITIPRLVQKRGAFRAALVVCLLGFSIGLVVSGTGTPVTRMAGLCIAAGLVVTLQALFWNLPLAMFSGRRAAVVIALINSFGNLGGFVAPNLRALADRVFEVPEAGLYAIATVAIIAILLSISLPKARGYAIRDDADRPRNQTTTGQAVR